MPSKALEHAGITIDQQQFHIGGPKKLYWRNNHKIRQENPNQT
jgi:hypothetical protein